MGAAAAWAGLSGGLVGVSFSFWFGCLPGVGSGRQRSGFDPEIGSDGYFEQVKLHFKGTGVVISEAQRLMMLAPKPGRLRVVLDSDTYNEIDDQFALVQVLLSPDRLNLEAIYATPFHNARSEGPGHGMELSYAEILRVLSRVGVSERGLVYRGVTEFVGFSKKAQAAEAVTDLIARARLGGLTDPLYVLAIGALSNVASAILQAPDIVERITIVWMGGNGPDWPRHFDQRGEFNLKQDIGAAQIVFNSGVPLVLVAAMPVASHLRCSVPEIERHVEPHGAIGAFLAKRFKDYSSNHYGWTKPIWDMAPVGWLLNADWAPSSLIPTPIMSDEMQWNIGTDRHLMRYVGYVDRDLILRDFFTKLAAGYSKYLPKAIV